VWSPTGETTQSITVTPTTTSTYVVTVTSNGCSASEDAVVSVNAKQVITLTSDKVNGCEPVTILFTNTTNNSNSILWNFGDGTTSTTSPVSHTYNAGVYNVSLTVTTSGCTSTLTNTAMINIYSNPNADFSWSGIDNNISFLSTSINSTKWLWSFGDNSTSNIENINHMYLSAGEYVVILNVENDNGCKDSITKTISIKDISTFFMPNAFSPNGDLINETYGPAFYNLEFEGFKYIIYNRWDGLIFETTNPEQRWDGKMKGNEVQEGVYVWRIDYTEKEGKIITRYGTVTLIK
jgi:gliding motility-associated-like protein